MSDLTREALAEALQDILDQFNRDNIRPGQAAFNMADIASKALALRDSGAESPIDVERWNALNAHLRSVGTEPLCPYCMHQPEFCAPGTCGCAASSPGEPSPDLAAALDRTLSPLADVPHNHDDGTCIACRRDGALIASRAALATVKPEERE